MRQKEKSVEAADHKGYLEIFLAFLEVSRCVRVESGEAGWQKIGGGGRSGVARWIWELSAPRKKEPTSRVRQQRGCIETQGRGVRLRGGRSSVQKWGR